MTDRNMPTKLSDGEVFADVDADGGTRVEAVGRVLEDGSVVFGVRVGPGLASLPANTNALALSDSGSHMIEVAS